MKYTTLATFLVPLGPSSSPGTGTGPGGWEPLLYWTLHSTVFDVSGFQEAGIWIVTVLKTFEIVLKMI